MDLLIYENGQHIGHAVPVYGGGEPAVTEKQVHKGPGRI